MTIKKNGTASPNKTDMKFDPELILRVEDNSDTFTIEVDGNEAITFSFADTILGIDNKNDEPNQLEFISKDWGSNTAYQIKLQNGTATQTKKLTIYDPYTNKYEIYDNMGNLFTITYNGPEPYAELNIYRDKVTEELWFQTKVGESSENCIEDIKIKLDTAVMRSVRMLIQQIQSYENYIVNYSNSINQRIKVDTLDPVSGQSIKLVPGEVSFRVTAVYEDIRDHLDIRSQWVYLDKYESSYGEIDNFDFVTMEGGSEGTSKASWVEYFDALSNYDINYIVPLTDDNAIHAELAASIRAISGNLGRERRAVIGGAVNETLNETIQRAVDLSYDRIQMVHGGFYDYEGARVKLYPPYILAAQHAGRAAFLEDGESATHDVYNMVAPEYILSREDLMKGIEYGVLVFEQVLGQNNTNQSYVRLVQDLTTDIINTDSVHTERGTGQLSDSINKEIRYTLDEMFTGKRMSGSDLVSAKVAVQSVLESRVRKGHILAYKNVYIEKVGKVMRVDFWAALSEINNFTLITAHYYSEPMSITYGSDSYEY